MSVPPRLAWLTDIHLDFLEPAEVARFCTEIRAVDPDAVLITGDISQAHLIEGHLKALEVGIDRPIWFVLGNHDFYRSGFAAVRRRVAELAGASANLRWLPASGPIALGPVVVAGEDGWPDARLGDYDTSDVYMNDFFLIEDLAAAYADGLDPIGDEARDRRRDLLRRFGDEAASRARDQLRSAFALGDDVIFLTHAPPFREACFFQGRISSDRFLPHMGSQAMGAMLLDEMRRRPTSRLLVLCGHTHGEARYEPLPNLTIRTGGAEYRTPRLCEVLSLCDLFKPPLPGSISG